MTPTTATGILLAILQQPERPGAAPPSEVNRLAAGEALSLHADRLGEHTPAIAAVLAQIARESTLPAHRIRAAAALLRLGVDELPETGAPPPTGPVEAAAEVAWERLRKEAP